MEQICVEENNSKGYVWKEKSFSKWYLDTRECITTNVEEISPSEANFDKNIYSLEEKEKINSGDMIISELGKLKVEKIEEDQAFLQMESEQVPVPLKTVSNHIIVNFLFVGKDKQYLVEKIKIKLNSNVEEVLGIASDYIGVPTVNLKIYFKNELLDNQKQISELDISNDSTFNFTFNKTEEYTLKRTTTNSTSWETKNNFISFTVDTDITITGFGLFGSSENILEATYDFKLVELLRDGSRITLINMMEINVDGTVDSNKVAKIICTPTNLKANTNYEAYVYHKLPGMRTYYGSSYPDSVIEQGVEFKFNSNTIPEHTNNFNSGHLPYIYFKIAYPF